MFMIRQTGKHISERQSDFHMNHNDDDDAIRTTTSESSLGARVQAMTSLTNMTPDIPAVITLKAPGALVAAQNMLCCLPLGKITTTGLLVKLRSTHVKLLSKVSVKSLERLELVYTHTLAQRMATLHCY